MLKKILEFDNKYDKVVTTFIEKEIKFEQSLRITNWDRPSDTITATSPEIHVNKMRRLSVRECAIIQTFPLEYEFVGNLSHMYTQIGNAVPVLLASKIAKNIDTLNAEQLFVVSEILRDGVDAIVDNNLAEKYLILAKAKGYVVKLE